MSHWWGHEKIVVFPISFSLSIVLPLFFSHYPLSLADLTCLLNRRLRSFSKVLALVFKLAERETHSHCHIFSSSLYYSMCFVLFFFQWFSFPQPLFSVSWPLRKELCKSKQLFSSWSLSPALSLRGDCVFFSSVQWPYRLAFKVKLKVKGANFCFDNKLCSGGN